MSRVIEGTYLDVAVDVVVDPFGVRHVFQHDVADLQRRLAEADLEEFDRPDLMSAGTTRRVPL